MPRKRTNLESLLARTRQEGGCLLWTGARASDGRYGSASYRNRTIRAHRLAYQLANGWIADEIHILHRCDRPLCINPSHLFEGDNATNSADRHAKGRSARGMQLNHPHRVLDDERVRSMRSLRAQGVQINRLAELFGCCESTVIDVTLNRTWGHVR